jgi:hypothetical protein
VKFEIDDAKTSGVEPVGTVAVVPAFAEQGEELGVAVGALGKGGCAVVGVVEVEVAVAVAVVAVVVVVVAVAVAAVAVVAAVVAVAVAVVDIQDQGNWSTNDASTRA